MEERELFRECAELRAMRVRAAQLISEAITVSELLKDAIAERYILLQWNKKLRDSAKKHHDRTTHIFND